MIGVLVGRVVMINYDNISMKPKSQSEHLVANHIYAPNSSRVVEFSGETMTNSGTGIRYERRVKREMRTTNQLGSQK